MSPARPKFGPMFWLGILGPTIVVLGAVLGTYTSLRSDLAKLDTRAAVLETKLESVQASLDDVKTNDLTHLDGRLADLFRLQSAHEARLDAIERRLPL